MAFRLCIHQVGRTLRGFRQADIENTLKKWRGRALMLIFAQNLRLRSIKKLEPSSALHWFDFTYIAF